MSRWHEARRSDPYFRDAKREGYRARSAYKLQQIQKRQRLLKPGQAVADLGAAPGGWSQVLVEIVGEEGTVVGVDLQRIRPIEGAQFIQGDFTDPATHDKLWNLLVDAGHDSLDAVVSDMAPDMTGNYDLDQARSVHLSEMALHFAVAHLKKDGTFCCKVFEGADFQIFREEVRKHFRKVQTYHPPASRKASSEVYVIAEGFRGPSPQD